MPLSVEDNFKLLAAYCMFDGNADKVASYMGITKNAVNKRYAKLIADEKAKAIKLGFLDGGTPTKKRAAPGGSPAAKKSKVTGETKAASTQQDGSDGEQGSKVEDDDDE